MSVRLGILKFMMAIAGLPPSLCHDGRAVWGTTRGPKPCSANGQDETRIARRCQYFSSHFGTRIAWNHSIQMAFSTKNLAVRRYLRVLSVVKVLFSLMFLLGSLVLGQADVA